MHLPGRVGFPGVFKSNCFYRFPTLPKVCNSHLLLIFGGLCTHGGSYGGLPANLILYRCLKI